jgi:Secretion system C-terminal sorting domain
MNKLLLIISIHFIGNIKSQTPQLPSQRYLDINKVKAYISNSGSNFFDRNDSLVSQGYEVPKGSGKKTSYANCLWFGGYGAGNNLIVAAQTYNSGGARRDFWPGPLNSSATINQSTSNYYAGKTFKINKTTIDSFIATWPSGSFQLPPSIADWPGNFPVGSQYPLAPFFDNDGDLIYNPIMGDYPLIKGDQAIFSVYNDVLSQKTATVTPAIGAEVRRLSYAYNCDTLTSNLKILNYTTFHEYTIVNKGTNVLDDFKVGIFEDTDLGNPMDDYIGCDVKNQVGYFYNSNSVDTNSGSTLGYQTETPIFAYKILPSNINYGFDNTDSDGDGAVDEADESLLKDMHVMNYFNNNSSIYGDPVSGFEYFNILNAKYRSTVNQVYGRLGIPYSGPGGNKPTRYCFPGTSDSTNKGTNGVVPINNIVGGWSETNNGLSTPNIPGDRRMVLSTPKTRLVPGQIIKFNVAIIFTENPQSLQFSNLLPMAQQDWQTITNMYTSNSFPSCNGISNNVRLNKNRKSNLIVFPNPTQNIFYIKGLNIEEKNVVIAITDINGKIIRQFKQDAVADYLKIDLKAFENGIYFISVNKNSTLKIIKAE